MPWIKVTDSTPAENEQVLIHDGVNDRIEFGRYVNGRWFVENSKTGQLSEVAGVTHWGPVLDSEEYDAADD